MRRSLDSADPNSLLRSTEWAHYKEDSEEFDSLTHDHDLLSRWAKKMHRLRGIFKLVCDWLTAVLSMLCCGFVGSSSVGEGARSSAQCLMTGLLLTCFGVVSGGADRRSCRVCKCNPDGAADGARRGVCGRGETQMECSVRQCGAHATQQCNMTVQHSSATKQNTTQYTTHMTVHLNTTVQNNSVKQQCNTIMCNLTVSNNSAVAM